MEPCRCTSKARPSAFRRPGLTVPHHPTARINRQTRNGLPLAQKDVSATMGVAMLQTTNGGAVVLRVEKRKTPQIIDFAGFLLNSGGERGIRTPDRLLTYTRFPGVRLKPLIHLSGGRRSIADSLRQGE
ncbi:hypothetical protein PSAC2689_70014 [Paraburkholderia sacchari]